MPSAKNVVQPPSLDACKGNLDDLVPRTIVIAGQSGAGKTTLAATAFADLSGPLAGTLPKNPIELKGAIWLSSDEQGTVALKARKIVPQFELDVRRFAKAANGDMGIVMRWLGNLIEEAAAAGGHTLVWDTASSLGDFLTGWFVYGTGCPETLRGEKNAMRGWGVVGDEYRRLYETASALGLRQIVLAHPKENRTELEADEAKPADADKAKAKALVAGMAGDNLITVSVAGNMFRKFLNGACSLYGWLDARDRNGKRSRTFFPNGGCGAQGKSRYEHILSTEEPADLRAVDAKILGAVK